MKIFNTEQIEYMRLLGLNCNFDFLSDDEFVEIEDVVAEALQKRGFDEDYNPTEECRMCESILDVLSEIDD